MSAQSLEGSNASTRNQPEGGILKGVLLGLIPLALLVVLVIAALLLPPLPRQLTAVSGFVAQQQVAVIVLIAGLGLAIVVYILALVLTLRRVRGWQPGGTQGRAALLALGATALIVVLPVLLAIVLPQSPAP